MDESNFAFIIPGIASGFVSFIIACAFQTRYWNRNWQWSFRHLPTESPLKYPIVVFARFIATGVVLAIIAQIAGQFFSDIDLARTIAVGCLTGGMAGGMFAMGLTAALPEG